MSKQKLFICECSSREHQIIIEHEEEDNILYVNIHLTKPSFWRRMKIGLKYIFGYQCKYGAFEEVILSKEHLPDLKELINKLEKGKS